MLFIDARGLRAGSCLVALLSLSLTASCGSSDDSSGTPQVNDEPAFEPPPASEAAPNEWGLAEEGLPSGYKLISLVAHEGDLRVSIEANEGSGLYGWQVDKHRWAREAPGPFEGERAGQLVSVPNVGLFGFFRKELARWNGADFEQLSALEVNIEALAGATGYGKLLAWTGSKESGMQVWELDLASDVWVRRGSAKTDFPFDAPDRVAGFAVTSDGSAFVSYAWAVRDSQGTLPAVWRQRDTGEWEDATGNLSATTEDGLPIALRNATGNGWGPMGAITASAAGDTVYASTEQGLFGLAAEGTDWNGVAAYTGNSGLSSSPGAFFALRSRVDMYPTPTRRVRLGQPRLYPCKRESFQRLATPDAQLVGALYVAEDCSTALDATEQRRLVVLNVDPSTPYSDRNLVPTWAGYLGGGGDDEAVALAYLPDAAGLVAVANIDGEGQIFRRDIEGRPLSEVSLGGLAEDAAVDPLQGSVVVVGSFGLARVLPDGDTRSWTVPLKGTGKRVDVGDDGLIVTLADKTVTVHDETGETRTSLVLERAFVTDLTYSSDSGLVYVGGFDNQRNGEPVQVPFVVALRVADLSQVWKAWGFNPDLLDSDMADARIYRLAMGEDGALYALGETAGGNTMFRWNGQDLSTATSRSFDPQSELTNTKSEHKTYVARLDALSGEVLVGQFAVARLSNGSGNTVKAEGGSLAADAAGRVFVGGVSAFQMAGRDLNLVDGQAIAPYAGGDASILVISPQFDERIRWTTPSRAAGKGKVQGIAASGGNAAALITCDGGDMFTLDETSAANPDPDDDKRDVHLMTWTE